MLVLLKALLGRHFKRILDQGHIETIIAGSTPCWAGFRRTDIAPVESIDGGVVEHRPTLSGRRGGCKFEYPLGVKIFIRRRSRVRITNCGFR